MKVDPKAIKYLSALGLSASLVISGGFLVAPWEGKINKVYYDPVNILTSCYGHTGRELKLGQTFTDEQCYEQLAVDLVKHQREVHRLITVPLNDYQEAALVSYTYNVGAGNLAKSTMRTKFNLGDYAGGCRELMKWVYAKGKRLNGLVYRRTDEMAVCLGDKEAIDFINSNLEVK